MAMPNGSAGYIWPESCWQHHWRTEMDEDQAHTMKWRLTVTSPEYRYGCEAKSRGVSAWPGFPWNTQPSRISVLDLNPCTITVPAHSHPVHRLEPIPSHSLTTIQPSSFYCWPHSLCSLYLLPYHSFLTHGLPSCYHPYTSSSSLKFSLRFSSWPLLWGAFLHYLSP